MFLKWLIEYIIYAVLMLAILYVLINVIGCGIYCFITWNMEGWLEALTFNYGEYGMLLRFEIIVAGAIALVLSAED